METIIPLIIGILTFVAGYFFAYKTAEANINWIKKNVESLESDIKAINHFINNEFHCFKAEMMDFQGFVKAKLEAMEQTIQDIKTFLKIKK